MDYKLNMSQQSSAAAMEANQILGCICRGIISRDTIVSLGAGQAAPGVLCELLPYTVNSVLHKETEFIWA